MQGSDFDVFLESKSDEVPANKKRPPVKDIYFMGDLVRNRKGRVVGSSGAFVSLDEAGDLRIEHSF